MTDDQFAAAVRQITQPLAQRLMQQSQVIKALQEAITKRPRTLTEEIDSIPGRRIFYNLMGHDTFDITQLHVAGDGIAMSVSQDGPFIQTHYPLVMWLPSAPTNATNLGFWSPITSWPLPTQQVGANQDRIDLSYTLQDGGSQRAFQNENVPGGLLSRPDLLIPLPAPTIWTPASIVLFTPIYENILFASGAAHATTEGSIRVAIPGYRIVNM